MFACGDVANAARQGVSFRRGIGPYESHRTLKEYRTLAARSVTWTAVVVYFTERSRPTRWNHAASNEARRSPLQTQQDHPARRGRAVARCSSALNRARVPVAQPERGRDGGSRSLGEHLHSRRRDRIHHDCTKSTNSRSGVAGAHGARRRRGDREPILSTATAVTTTFRRESTLRRAFRSSYLHRGCSIWNRRCMPSRVSDERRPRARQKGGRRRQIE